jgi:hypothetical protein
VQARSAVVLLHMIENRRLTAVPEFELRDVRTETLDVRITGRAQAATCVFCRKTLVSWRARPASKRRSSLVPRALEQAIATHTPSCAEAWLWSVLARWSTGFATAAERDAIAIWRERDFGADAAALFDRLPQPPGSDVAHEIEVALIAISRAWQH